MCNCGAILHLTLFSIFELGILYAVLIYYRHLDDDDIEQDQDRFVSLVFLISETS